MSNAIVVVAVDMHKGSNLVMSRALAQACASGAQLHVLCVAEPNISGKKAPDAVDIADLTGQDVKQLPSFVEKRVADYQKKHPGVAVPTISHHTASGDAAEQIVALATRVDADLVVVGTHGRTGLKRLLIGSVAEKVVRLAGCPVLVVREKKHETQG